MRTASTLVLDQKKSVRLRALECLLRVLKAATSAACAADAEGPAEAIMAAKTVLREVATHTASNVVAVAEAGAQSVLACEACKKVRVCHRHSEVISKTHADWTFGCQLIAIKDQSQGWPFVVSNTMALQNA